MSQKQEEQSCYLCGGIADTRDHVPPRGIFSEPRPSDLITVPCCGKCNNQFSTEDEWFRTLIGMHANLGDTAKQVTEKIAKKAAKSPRIGKQFKELVGSFRKTLIGGSLFYTTEVAPRPVRKQLIRITKGLLCKFYPEKKAKDFEWSVDFLDQLKMDNIFSDSRFQNLKHLNIGQGAYQAKYEIASDRPDVGLWIHLFHNRVGFLVQHQNRTENRRNSSVPFKRYR